MRNFAFVTTLLLVLASSATAQTIDRIKETQQIKLGYRVDAPPLSFLDSQNLPAGYSPMICSELAKEIATVLKIDDLNVEYVPVDTKNRFDKVANGEIDLLCGAATITLERRKLVDFSIPTYVDGSSVILPRDGAKSMTELDGKTVGMRSETTTEQAVKNSFESAGLEARMERFNNHKNGINALVSGQIDAYFADMSILLAYYVSDNLSNRFRLLDDILTIEKHGLALKRGDSEFRLLVDTGLSKMYARGTMQRAFKSVLPGADPGVALRALYMISPTLP
ncbi:MAG: amino acid ABC transporter substrate-binding protein [Pseudomonadota bacterium]